MAGGSEKLKELQLQMEQESSDLQTALDSEPREIRIGGGTFRVSDSREATEEERKVLLRRQAAAKENARHSITPWKIWSVVGITVVASLLLLWALFSGATPEQYSGTTSKPMHINQLKELHPEDPCPDPWWIPEECIDNDKRTRSKSTLEYCNEFFEEYGYTLEMLKECGILN